MDKISWLPGYHRRFRVTWNMGWIHKLVLHKGSGPDTLDDLYLNGRCADFSKLIYTQGDGVTPFLDKEIEIIDDDRAVLWVKIAEGRSIFIYPGDTADDPAPAPAGVENSAGRG